MPSTWDPRELLDCDPRGYFTCVGMTLKGSRCRNSVNVDDRNKASKLLDRISRKEPRDVRLAELETLAELTLCLRWHRYHPRHGQVESVSREWLETIHDEYPERAIRDPSPRPRTRIVAVETISASAAQSRSANVRRPAVALRTPSPSPPPSLTNSRPQTRATPLRRPAAILRTPSPSPPPSPYRRSASPSPTNSRPQTRATPLRRPAAILRTPSPSPPPPYRRSASPSPTSSRPQTPAAEPPAVSIVESLPSPPRTPSPASEVQPRNTARTNLPSTSQTVEAQHHHSRRRPITDPCPICTSEICCEDDAVWCRAQCGQSIHRGCFASWRTECLAKAESDIRVRVTCVYCRATWKWEWEE